MASNDFVFLCKMNLPRHRPLDRWEALAVDHSGWVSCFSQQNFQNQLAERLTAYSEIKIKSRKATELIYRMIDTVQTHTHINLTGEIFSSLFSCFLHSLHSHTRSPIQFNQFKCTFPVSKFTNKSSYSFTTFTWFEKETHGIYGICYRLIWNFRYTYIRLTSGL